MCVCMYVCVYINIYIYVFMYVICINEKSLEKESIWEERGDTRGSRGETKKGENDVNMV